PLEAPDRAKRLECVRFIGAFRRTGRASGSYAHCKVVRPRGLVVEPHFLNPKGYRNPNGETGYRTPERRSTFELRISFVICHSSFVIRSWLALTTRLANPRPGIVKCLPCYNNKLCGNPSALRGWRSEEHTSELQSRF